MMKKDMSMKKFQDIILNYGKTNKGSKLQKDTSNSMRMNSSEV